MQNSINLGKINIETILITEINKTLNHFGLLYNIIGINDTNIAVYVTADPIHT